MTAAAAARKHLEQYETEGFIGPLKAFEEAEMKPVAEAVLAELRKHNESLLSRRNRHLDWPVAEKLVRSHAMLESAQLILGQELVLWRTNFFIGYQGHGLGWHQDEYHTLLSDPMKHLSIHLGITAAPADNCVMLVPGSHLLSREEVGKMGFNLKPGGGKGTYGTFSYWRDPERHLDAVKMVLRPGEYFVFHSRLLHASRDVTVPSDKEGALPRKTVPRLGMGLRVTTPDNTVLPAAFAETPSRKDHCVPMNF